MAEAGTAMTPALLNASKRDPRIDVLRGIALVMIFVDHIPGNTLSSPALRALAGRRFFRPLEACGRHSLEVFAVGCISSLFGRLLFLTYGAGPAMQIAINVVGLATMLLVGLHLERRRYASLRQTLVGGTA